MPPETRSRSASLDGVRALAIVAVLAFHAHYDWAAGGYLGVDLFFVLSGFLITGVLLSTHRSWWGYRRFLVRRTVRLVPALLLAMAAATLVGLVLGDAPGQVARCTAAAVTYTMNLPATGGWHCSAMWHVTWSLAAEQQFYLLWPLLLAGVAVAVPRLRPAGRLRPASSSRRVRWLLVAAGLCVAGYLVGLAHQAVATSQGRLTVGELQFAPDGRSLVLLLGCALALATASRRRTRTLPGAGPVALVALVVLTCCLAQGRLGDAAQDRWPLPAAGLLSVLLIGALVHSPSTATAHRLLGAAPVAWLGRVSYSLYLWHEIAYRVTDRVAPSDSLLATTLRFVLALALAAASYHWVEQPTQRWWRARGGDSREVSGLASADAGSGPSPSSRTPLPRPSGPRPAAALRSTPAAPR